MKKIQTKTSGTLKFTKNAKQLEVVFTFTPSVFEKCSKKRKTEILLQLVKFVGQELEKIK